MFNHVALRLSLALTVGAFLYVGPGPGLFTMNEAAAAPRCPNLTILLDQSASMSQTPAGSIPMPGEQSKWDIATSVLTNLITKYDGLLPIGYSNFPYQNASCDTRGFYVTTTGKTLSPAYGNRQDIYNAMHAYPTAYPWSGGSTPTCTAVANLAMQPQLQDPTRGQYILLVTDGAPEAQCCPTDPVQTTVAAISAADAQSPAVQTFVVGFGIVPAQAAALDSMAVAGGVPDNDPNHKFYVATDETTLDAKISGILSQLVGGDAGAPVTCEDGCYGTPCAAGSVCLQDQCVTNPCATQTCPSGQTCLFNGTTASCIGVCAPACPLGATCNNGQCVPNACGGPCASGQMCDTSSDTCVPDPKCQNVACHETQGCIAGKCVDDPCVYTTCPAGTQCLAFTGQCMAPRDPNETEPGNMATGCAVGPGRRSHASELGPLCALLALIVLAASSLRRRRIVG